MQNDTDDRKKGNNSILDDYPKYPTTDEPLLFSDEDIEKLKDTGDYERHTLN